MEKMEVVLVLYLNWDVLSKGWCFIKEISLLIFKLYVIDRLVMTQASMYIVEYFYILQ
uniref:Uncharacterized protein n=1 Tax=Octopus bimaculoides TaxID=37653 RepID=A0A0L8GJ37_OCTBM